MEEPVPKTQAENREDRGLTIREAASRMRVSVPTVRRRIRRGALRARLVQGPFGVQWEIPPDSLEEGSASTELSELLHWRQRWAEAQEALSALQESHKELTARLEEALRAVKVHTAEAARARTQAEKAMREKERLEAELRVARAALAGHHRRLLALRQALASRPPGLSPGPASEGPPRPRPVPQNSGGWLRRLREALSRLPWWG
jgi:excisionase family DNA binding protein